ncbi:MAG TPA: DUF2784 domain-containing protein [Burkholderiales bacterium]|nr:DUF2784 domain-containing protein [Burkholderiales bacterium]
MVLLADVVLAVHFLFVLFVVGGLALIWIGVALKWRWVRNPWFRLAHLAAIVFVAAETLLGLPCPLTVWEDELRGRAPHMDFIARLVHQVMFYSFPEWVFATAYVVFALIVLITCLLVPPTWPRRGQ